MDSMTLDRIRGTAVGAAVGDAMGMPLEFGLAIPEDRLVRDMLPGRAPAGMFTDDTEMAIALAESLVARRPLDPRNLAERFLDWFRRSPDDVGIHTSSVLRMIQGGRDWDSAARSMQKFNPDSAGNGSLMRCWPVALAYWDEPDQRRADSALQSQVTHRHPECVSACVLVNEIIANLIHGEEIPAAVKHAAQSIPLDENLVELVEKAPFQQRENLPNSGWIRHTLQSALWGLMTTHSFEEAVVQVVNLGSDADTAGSIVGAMAGAAYGLESIPADWQRILNGEWPLRTGSAWGTAQFIELADRLCKPA